ncbi:MAG TPA: acyl-CoA dehydrogenase [Algoriphagus sp.]|jgi:butyryl-CoA dehydrogenase|uniref:acyl-CoA dehydrogenase n=2 Tax=Algoriphagus TaxID=246875 RepID=UPI000C47A652|nr:MULTISPECIES: acyl-CoA dehydrogenase [unclassified Algoriphagus]MAL14747.1 acyl-CoA dehydrogenase [Algoriphagus sp.]HAS57697.1 acyl-CoA dehydrogenase [Algoriphagus sp.]HCB47264.1 acyl-CoA dehydrogenase [Algoriphagus sp.]HCD87171.1 acyl-CoA dehydrogenase [Algoriphagus sp.]HCX77141.1 acyl-CoA dehydrogenase [Algoriphagus sp.]
MTQFYSKRDLKFQLFELIKADELNQIEYFKDHNRETFEMILEAADQIAQKSLRPLLTEMDRNEPQLENGKIKIHPKMKPIIQQFGKDGWINATFSYEEGGQQLPWTIHIAAGFILQAANYSASVFPFLTTGAANLIRTFGSKELIEKFTPNLYSGLWQGTMALTEPDAGSSLSDLSTTAFPTDEAGVYKIKGQKIYISCGDHDACENIIHLMLARIDGAPAGTKGISLFVVPQKRIDTEESNDVLTQGIYHKMGYKGAPIAHLMIGSEDQCEGYLVGEANQGLKYMFQMMNEARLGVGMNGVAIATAAYYSSLAYAKERPQGRRINNKDLNQPQVPIIEHADVKRMLLFQKSVTEGSLALLLYCSKLADEVQREPNSEKKKAKEALLDLLTPIAKSYPSEMGVHSTSAAVQVLGGAGYTTDFPVEQYYREARIHPIHEGTTGIHGLDLLGRKVLMSEGLAWKLLHQEILKSLNQSSLDPNLKSRFEKYHRIVLETAEKVLARSKKGLEYYLADATLFLEMCGILCVAWKWLDQSHIAQSQLNGGSPEKAFYQGKIMASEYFMEYELTKIESLAARLQSENYPTLEMKNDWF